MDTLIELVAVGLLGFVGYKTLVSDDSRTSSKKKKVAKMDAANEAYMPIAQVVARNTTIRKLVIVDLVLSTGDLIKTAKQNQPPDPGLPVVFFNTKENINAFHVFSYPAFISFLQSNLDTVENATDHSSYSTAAVAGVGHDEIISKVRAFMALFHEDTKLDVAVKGFKTIGGGAVAVGKFVAKGAVAVANKLSPSSSSSPPSQSPQPTGTTPVALHSSSSPPPSLSPLAPITLQLDNIPGGGVGAKLSPKPAHMISEKLCDIAWKKEYDDMWPRCTCGSPCQKSWFGLYTGDTVCNISFEQNKDNPMMCPLLTSQGISYTPLTKSHAFGFDPTYYRACNVQFETQTGYLPSPIVWYGQLPTNIQNYIGGRATAGNIILEKGLGLVLYLKKNEHVLDKDADECLLMARSINRGEIKPPIN